VAADAEPETAVLRLRQDQEMGDNVTLLLCGDVMLGRGLDQILAHPDDPTLHESYLHDARGYVGLAERVSGVFPRPVSDTWPWGEALSEIERSRPGILLINVETSVTTSSDFAPGKSIHYRMSPDNLGCLMTAHPDVCVLANNHVLDLGAQGLQESLQRLAAAGLATAGAGHDLASASAPAVVSPDGIATVSVLAYAHRSSGVPAGWAATEGRPGVALLPDLSTRTAAAIAARIDREKARGAIVVVSLHWGSNWGYDIPGAQVRFAHRLVDAGADIVHGHSSHHPRPIEVYADRLVLYGCGDFINDYEGIGGHEEYRGELRLLYRAAVAPDGTLVGVDLLPFVSRRLRLERAVPSDVKWLVSVLDRESRRYGVRLHGMPDETIALHR
jgi:poly-gamma-glutamate synthesis protein (capsule biosynthesis protein)